MSSEDSQSWRAATAATLHEARRKHGRGIGQKKSRSGCATCKSRRIKCDETRPVCKRCSSSNRRCIGYPGSALQYATPANGQDRLLSIFTLDARDVRSFDYLTSWVAPRLAGSFDQDFWCKHVLQVAHAEPLVLDALLAIATLYEHPPFLRTFASESSHRSTVDVMLSQDSIKVDGSDEAILMQQSHIKALEQYNRAIATFHSRMNTGDMSPILALLSCVLFIYIEFIRENNAAAIELFVKGRQLTATVSAFSTATERHTYSVLKLMLHRIGAFSMECLFGGLATPTATLSGPLQILRLPSISTLYEARTTLFELIAAAQTLGLEIQEHKPCLGGVIHSGVSIYNTRYVHDNGMLGDADTRPLDSGVERWAQTRLAFIARRDQILQRLDEWLSSLMALKSTDPVAKSCLLMHYHIAYIWQATLLSNSKMVFDEHTSRFQQVLDHAQVYIAAKANEQNSWTSEVGSVPPLFFVATKCRVSHIRHRALELLERSPRKECMWAAQLCSEVAMRVVLVEEEYKRSSLHVSDETDTRMDGNFMPDHNSRIHHVEVFNDMPSGRFKIRVSRYTEDGQGRRRCFRRAYPIYDQDSSP